VKSDGSIWLADPPFGILGNYEGRKAEPQLPQNVYSVECHRQRGTRGRSSHCQYLNAVARTGVGSFARRENP
jgi:hypothetical protein